MKLPLKFYYIFGDKSFDESVSSLNLYWGPESCLYIYKFRYVFRININLFKRMFGLTIVYEKERQK